MKTAFVPKSVSRRMVIRTTAIAVIGVLTVGLITVIGNKQVEQSSAAAGWVSGMPDLKDNSDGFGVWRGEPSGITGCWADTDDGNQRYMWCYREYMKWSGDFDLAPGFIVKGESMAAAASGAYEGRWREAMANVRNYWGSKKTVYIRPAHEMNGTWYPWSVTNENAADFKKAWVRYYNIIQQELVQKGYNAKVVFNVNKDPNNYVKFELFWPGDQYVDVYGVDFYDNWPKYPDQAAWDTHYNQLRGGIDAPYGIGTHMAYAKAHGKPMAFPEWATEPSLEHKAGTDNPFFIEKMNEFMRTNAGTGPGQVLYDLHFGVWNGTRIWPTTSIPNTAAKYRSLSWGSGSVPTNPNPTPNQPTPPTPTPPTSGDQISQVNNLANGKTFVSSVGSHPSEPNNPVSHVNDKNESTRWISAPQENALLSTDLGTNHTLSRVSVLWAGDTTRNYDLQVSSDNTTWKTVASGSTNGTSPQIIHTTSFTSAATGRYFRIVAKDRHNTSYGNSIFEIGLYGSPGGTTPTPTPNPVLGDANGDGKVNALDLSVLMSNDGKNYPPADFNGDGTVGAADMAILLARWTW